MTTTPIVRRERDTLRLRLWWSADAPIDRDYSVGIFLRWRDGALITQSDSAPQVIVPEGAPVETSRWQTDTIYIEERVLTLPEGLRLDTAQLLLTVYGSWDNRRIDAPGVDDERLLQLEDVAIAAW